MAKSEALPAQVGSDPVSGGVEATPVSLQATATGAEPVPMPELVPVAEEGSRHVVHYPGAHIFRAREMSRADWIRFGVPEERLPEPSEDGSAVTRWGPENGWNVPVEEFGFLENPSQLESFAAANGLEIREA